MRIPQELRELNRWTSWKLIDDKKMPINRKGRPFKWRSEPWYPFDITRGMGNKGFRLTDDYVAIDLDNCFDKNEKLRPWAKTDDYWTVKDDLTRAILNEYKRQGIEIPFPQMDVHMVKE